MKKNLILLLLLTSIITLGSKVFAESIKQDWNDNSWQHYQLQSGGFSAVFGYQLKVWSDNSYYSHSSNHLTATPMYLDIYGISPIAKVEVQLKICFGEFEPARISNYRVMCWPSKVLKLAYAQNHFWTEIDSRDFDISSGGDLTGIYDVVMTPLIPHYEYPGSSRISDIFYYESYQFLEVWANGSKIFDEKIDLLQPIKK